jgi:hypothetical protein
MSLIRGLYNNIDRRIVSSLEGNRITGKFIYPFISPEKQREYYIQEYFKSQPSVFRELILLIYLKIRDTSYGILKHIYRKARMFFR